MRVRNSMQAPFMGRTRIEPGAEGEVDLNRPGVRKMIDIGHLVPLDEVPGEASSDATLAEMRESLKVARTRAAELEVVNGALRNTNDALAQSDRPRLRPAAHGARDESEAMAQMRAQFDLSWRDLAAKHDAAVARIAELEKSAADSDAHALAMIEETRTELTARENELAAARARIVDLETALAAVPVSSETASKKKKAPDATGAPGAPTEG